MAKKDKPVRRTPPPPREVPVSPVITEEFTYTHFKKIADLVPFTQKEWAQILHLSERTLQRYARDHSGFEGLYIDRLLHIEQLIEKGLDTFAGADAFYTWLRKEKSVLGHQLGFSALYSTQGIQGLIDQLERIQYAVYT